MYQNKVLLEQKINEIEELNIENLTSEVPEGVPTPKVYPPQYLSRNFLRMKIKVNN